MIARQQHYMRLSYSRAALMGRSEGVCDTFGFCVYYTLVYQSTAPYLTSCALMSSCLAQAKRKAVAYAFTLVCEA